MTDYFSAEMYWVKGNKKIKMSRTQQKDNIQEQLNCLKLINN